MSKAPRSACSRRASPRRRSLAESSPRRRPKPRWAHLVNHITGGAEAETYQPMNVNFGLMPPITEKMRKADRKKGYTDRARAAMAASSNVASN